MVAKNTQTFENEYDLDRICIPITLRQGGQSKQYRMYEASGEAAGKYRNAMIAGITLGPEGKPQKIGKIADLEPLLVSLCVVEVTEDGKERAVSESVVKSWPSRVQKSLFDRIKQISDLEEESPEKQTLEEALQHSSSPIPLKDFRAWVSSLPDMDEKYDYRPLKQWLKPSAEDLVKNERSDTTVG